MPGTAVNNAITISILPSPQREAKNAPLDLALLITGVFKAGSSWSLYHLKKTRALVSLMFADLRCSRPLLPACPDKRLC